MRRLGLVVVLLVSLATLGVGRALARPACLAPSCTDNTEWTTTLSGPATAVVGQTVTYTATLASDGGAWAITCGIPCATLTFPAGATAITVAVAGDAGTCSGATFAASPATFACGGLTFSLNGGATFQPVVFTVTLTLGAGAGGTFTVPYSDLFSGSATITTVLAVPQLPTNTFTPASSVGLNYSGQAWDPRCEFGCPPNGLP